MCFPSFGGVYHPYKSMNGKARNLVLHQARYLANPLATGSSLIFEAAATCDDK